MEVQRSFHLLRRGELRQFEQEMLFWTDSRPQQKSDR
jgi:hypothetical protein